LLLLALFLSLPLAAHAQDPLTELKRILAGRPTIDPLAPAEKQQQELKQYYDEREQKLGKIIDTRLKTIGQLRQALMLKDWGDVIKTQREDPEVIASDARLRSKIADRFRAIVHRVVESGDDDSKAAVANLIAEMGLTVRAVVNPEQAGKLEDIDAARRGGFARSMIDDVIQLTMSPSTFVRLHALRALGGMNADPRKAVPVLAAQLTPANDVAVRRVAADSLLRVITVANYLKEHELGSPPVFAKEIDVLIADAEVARNAPSGLTDADAEVRARCAEALRAGAAALASMFQRPQEETKKLGPGPGLHIYSLAEVNAIKDVLKAYATAGPRLAASLADPSAEVRAALVQGLERLSDARYRLAEDPVTIGAPGRPSDRVLLVPPQASDPLGIFAKGDWRLVAQLIGDPDVRVRRAAVNFLEFFAEARPTVVHDFARALSDRDQFVRWTAARALGYFTKNYQPKDAVPAVPALAKMLFDPDFPVRLVAAATLESLGQYAEAAVPELARAIGFGDAENRVAALYIIQSIGPERTKSLISPVTEVLKQDDPRVRRAAAETLGKYGPLARNRSTVDALRRALGDDDQEVRINASEALLEVLGTDAPAKKL
jgi:HEAT repeat protein